MESNPDKHATGICKFKHSLLEMKLKCGYLRKHNSNINLHFT
jgi:hypothetical protein